MLLLEAIATAADARGGAPAIVLDDREMSYAALDVSVARAAVALSGARIVPGMPVGLIVDDIPLHIVVLLALFRLGAPVLPLASADPPALRRSLIARAGVRAVVGAAARAADLGVPYVAIESLAGAGVGRLPPYPKAGATAWFGRSSGTTAGVPKLVAVTFEALAARDRRFDDRHPYRAADRHLVAAPFSGMLGRFHVMHALAAGAAVVFPAGRRAPRALAAAARRHRATMTALTPPIVRALLREAGARPLFPGVRVLVGTAALTAAERRAAMAGLSPDLYLSYGTNETGALVLAGPDDLGADIDTAGRPLPGIAVAACAEDGTPLPPGRIGALRFRGPAFPDRYLDEAPGSAGRFDAGWFAPGDAGAIDAAGRVRLAGRIDDLISVGGQKVYPADIERALAAHPAVAAAAVVPVADPDQGEAPVAVVVARTPVDERALLAACAEAIARRLRPRRILFLDALPEDASGKVDRRALRAIAAAAIDGDARADAGDAGG